ncbi:MAG: Putative phosphatase [uncultured Sphingomonadaceae bacterium]|uniref:Phosphatase n=1 Tax=uncultured Sphingomonadaceae bacterium TaxID=169976 RepID=A0A6J4U4V8_9SPHN|nr:MAG: Putative phosphatase [uncultured Sphingomonadaceae bacterium]
MDGTTAITTSYTDGDVDTNRSNNLDLHSLVEQRYSRRQTMMGGLGALSAAALSTTLAGCGGDDDDNDTVAETPPATTVTLGGQGQSSSGKVVSLTGTMSGGAAASTMSISQVSGPPVALSSTGPASATFVAPSVAAATPVVFRLTATDASGRQATGDATVTIEPARLDFAAVPKNLNDVVTVPAGYTATVLYRLGDPLNAGTGPYANNGTDTGFSSRAGDHGDALYYYGLTPDARGRDDNNSRQGLLVMNHENITQRYLHPNGPTNSGPNGTRPEAEALKEMEAHGVSVVEVARAGDTGAWSYVQTGQLNRRITPLTPTQINGPVRGSALVRTRYSADGTAGRGTINNCANGYTPWATNLTCEENWAGYFRRVAATDNPRRTAKEIAGFNRYGVGGNGNYGWASVQTTERDNTIYLRWNASVQGATAADDFRNEANQYGWVVEIDPYDPSAAPRKRTALGRFNHEGAWPGNFVAGRRPAFYMGDDARGEYVYKFVSATPWAAADAQRADRLAVGDKYLDSGTLYVARFAADGSGVWLPLVFGQGPLTAANPAYAFADQADVLVHTRLAADALGATRMDRPEWTAVNPATGEMYLTLTNNTQRTAANTDAANPRAYVDPKQPTGDQVNADPASPLQRTTGNANGHILRLREAGDTTEATTFRWDNYLFGAGSDLDAANINVSGLTAQNDLSSPDGLWFGRPTNASGNVKPVLWIQTDDGAFTDVTNCMMLAAMPGVTGDGGARTITNNDGTRTGTQATLIGATPTAATLRRFLVGPNECEITGVDSTPDGRSLFVNIQHPGEDGTLARLTSNWPASQTGPAPGVRPRSATVVITKDDGGVVGL